MGFFFKTDEELKSDILRRLRKKGIKDFDELFKKYRFTDFQFNGHDAVNAQVKHFYIFGPSRKETAIFIKERNRFLGRKEQGLSRREVLAKMAKGTAVVGGAAVVGKFGIDVLSNDAKPKSNTNVNIGKLEVKEPKESYYLLFKDNTINDIQGNVLPDGKINVLKDKNILVQQAYLSEDIIDQKHMFRSKEGVGVLRTLIGPLEEKEVEGTKLYFSALMNDHKHDAYWPKKMYSLVKIGQNFKVDEEIKPRVPLVKISKDQLERFLNKQIFSSRGPIRIRELFELMVHDFNSLDKFKFKVKPEWVIAMVAIESTFDPHRISDTSAKGLMQLMEDACIEAFKIYNPISKNDPNPKKTREAIRSQAKAFYNSSKVFDIEENLKYGIAYFAYCINYFYFEFSHIDEINELKDKRIETKSYFIIAKSKKDYEGMKSYQKDLNYYDNRIGFLSNKMNLGDFRNRMRFVIAAYNAGPTSLMQMAEKYSYQFNKIKSKLPKETEDHVTKFMDILILQNAYASLNNIKPV